MRSGSGVKFSGFLLCSLLVTVSISEYLIWENHESNTDCRKLSYVSMVELNKCFSYPRASQKWVANATHYTYTRYLDSQCVHPDISPGANAFGRCLYGTTTQYKSDKEYRNNG